MTVTSTSMLVPTPSDVRATIHTEGEKYRVELKWEGGDNLFHTIECRRSDDTDGWKTLIRAPHLLEHASLVTRPGVYQHRVYAVNSVGDRSAAVMANDVNTDDAMSPQKWYDDAVVLEPEAADGMEIGDVFAVEKADYGRAFFTYEGNNIGLPFKWPRQTSHRTIESGYEFAPVPSVAGELQDGTGERMVKAPGTWVNGVWQPYTGDGAALHTDLVESARELGSSLYALRARLDEHDLSYSASTKRDKRQRMVRQIQSLVESLHHIDEMLDYGVCQALCNEGGE